MTIVVVGAFAMISVSLLLTALVRSERREMEAVRPEHADLTAVASLKSAQREALNSKAVWKNKALGVVKLPIERAVAVVLAEYRANPEAASPAIPEGMRLTPEGKLVPMIAAVPVVVQPGSVDTAKPNAPGAVVAAPAVKAVPAPSAPEVAGQ